MADPNAPPAASESRALADHRRSLRGVRLDALLAADATRSANLSWHWNDWLVDLSKERWTTETLALLQTYAQACGLEQWISALFAGEKVNLSERRPALHTALRQQDDTPLLVDGHDVMRDIREVQSRMKAFADAVRAGTRLGATGKPIRAVVNIGIGGSDLGPLLVCDALGAIARNDDHSPDVIEARFVSNVDPEHLTRALHTLDPASTLFIVTSKTFTTQETLANATSARAWLSAALPRNADVRAHFVAVTSNVPAATQFGVDPDNVFPMWDFVGGRYSLWSAVGLSIAVRIGWDGFSDLLRGAAEMDVHFRTTPFARNLPVLLGLLGVWNTRYVGHPDRVIVPYAQALARLPAYLQQLILESNGKRVGRDGGELTGPTAPSIWGAPGTNGQHAFFQWLHQGTRETPVEFIVPMRAVHPLDQQQALLVANALAQSQALLVGRDAATVRAELAAKGSADAQNDAAIAARVCPGDRASTVILIPKVDARNLGALIALYEHRVFVEATLYGINPFDQWGVELGKTLAGPLIASLTRDAPLPERTDASTRGLVAHVQSFRRGDG